MNAALEDRAGVESLETLHAERRKINERLAPLKAVHGHNGVYDARRQQMTRAMQVRAAATLTGRGEKATDRAVEAAALNDPQYLAWLDRMEAEKVAFINCQTELDEIDERIRNREIGLLCFNSEVKLAR
jgi:hypothetical protein